ncbi:hypothetical protein PCASD_12281 [Puccinia coronata f. sp. avenae]|uniref:Uncharacterized protein n=1 Tax=Puccinia coronata f. sp. avenae TaxID=200324 RepID=A0A2N5URC0_9BASI|nr:hypothetical protein PCASD_12281 [Puccinia coronata f. sp. avenae]
MTSLTSKSTADMTPEIDPSLPSYDALVEMSASSAPSCDSAQAQTQNKRVLGLSPAIDFNCAISFVIFIPEKNKKGAITWVPVKSKPGLAIVFNRREHYSLVDFQKLVADRCNSQFAGIADMIMDGSSSSPPTINWSAYILKHCDWPKASPKPIGPDGAFETWFGEINGRAKGGIIISMDNPKDKASRAHKEDLMARTLRRLEARRNGPRNVRTLQGSTSAIPADGDEEQSEGPDLSGLIFYIDKIYAEHKVHTAYNRIHMVHLDPSNSDCYILLLPGNTEEWAQALANKIPGVSPTSPPNSIRWLDCQYQRGRNQSRRPTGDVKHTLGEYLEFIQLAPHRREGVLNILLSNDIDHYKMFKLVTVESLTGIGLNIGVITKL